MICNNSGGNDSLSENNADSVFGCCMINSSTEFIKKLLNILTDYFVLTCLLQSLNLVWVNVFIRCSTNFIVNNVPRHLRFICGWS